TRSAAQLRYPIQVSSNSLIALLVTVTALTDSSANDLPEDIGFRIRCIESIPLPAGKLLDLRNKGHHLRSLSVTGKKSTAKALTSSPQDLGWSRRWRRSRSRSCRVCRCGEFHTVRKALALVRIVPRAVRARFTER